MKQTSDMMSLFEAMAEADSASFEDRDEKLFRLNIDLRMEQIRQNSAQCNFDHFQSILKRNLKEKKIVADTSEDLKTDLQKAVNYLSEHDVEEEEDCRVLESIEQLASSLRLSRKVKSEGFDLIGDFICLQVNTDGKTIDTCFISYAFDSEPRKSEIIQRCLQQNQVEEITSSLRKMAQLIPANLQMNEKRIDSNTIGQVLSVLENDVMELKRRSLASNEFKVNKYSLEHCFSRTECSPLTIVLSAEPFLRDMLQSPSANESLLLYDRVLYSAYLCLEKTDVLNYFPSNSFLGNSKTGWTEELKKALPVEYSLRFSRPILVSQANFSAIKNLEGVTSIKELSRVNLFRHLSGCYQDFIKLNCAALPELLQQYEMTDFSNLNSEDVIISQVNFIHPQNLTLALQIIRVQLLYNSLFESLCHRPTDWDMVTRDNKMCIQCSIASSSSSLFSMSFAVGQMTVAVKLSINNGLIKVDTTFDDAHSGLLPQLKSLCDNALKSTHSIPLLIHVIGTQVQNKFLQLGIPLTVKPRGGQEDGRGEGGEEEENQFVNINTHTSSSTCLLANSKLGKTGQSWLFVDHKMSTQSKLTNHSQKKRMHTFVVLKEQNSNSLLRSIKQMGLVRELIPVPPSTLSHPTNNNNFGLSRHLSSAAGHPLARPPVSDGLPKRSTETTQATLNYAFSDLEAIAEMGVADDAESVMSETHSNISSSILDCSPSATAQAYQQGDKARQLSPIEQAKLSTLYRRRLMQQQQAGQQSNLQNSEVFDFRSENEHGIHMQSPNLTMPGNSSAPFDNSQFISGQFDPLGLSSPAPFTPSTSGRRRGRGRKGGNSGDRMPSMDLSDLPESPEYIMGQSGTRKARGGTSAQRRTRKPRKPSNVGSEQSYMVPYAGGERPLLQRSFSKQSASYVPSPNEDMQMKMEMEFCYDYSSDEETDPPPPRNLEPLSSTSSTTRQKGVKTALAAKPIIEEQAGSSRRISEGGGKPPNLQQISKVASLSSNNSSSTTASPSPQEVTQKVAPTANESNSLAQLAGKAIKMDTAAASPTNKDISLLPGTKAKPFTAARKPSIQPAKLVEPKLSALSTGSSAPPNNSSFDLYDNGLDDSSTPSKPEPSPKTLPKEKVKLVVSNKPTKEKSSSFTLKDKDQSKRKSSKTAGQKSDETLKVVLKLPKASKETSKYDQQSAKCSSSSSPSSSSTSSIPAAPVYAAPVAATVNSAEPIARLSSHAAPPSKSKLSIQSRYGVDVGVQQRQQAVKRKSSLERTSEERRKKARKEATKLAAPSGIAPVPANKPSLIKDASKTSKKSGASVAATSQAIGTEYSSLVNTPSKFMSLKGFRIPKVVDQETTQKVENTAGTSNEPKSNPSVLDVTASALAKSHQTTSQDLQRRPSKSILKNSTHLPGQIQQQQMAPSYRGQTPQNRKALLPSPMDKRPSPRPIAPTPPNFQGSYWPIAGAQKAANTYAPAKDWAFQSSSTAAAPAQNSANEHQQQQQEQLNDSFGRDNSPSEELRICDEED